MNALLPSEYAAMQSIEPPGTAACYTDSLREKIESEAKTAIIYGSLYQNWCYGGITLLFRNPHISYTCIVVEEFLANVKIQLSIFNLVTL